MHSSFEHRLEANVVIFGGLGRHVWGASERSRASQTQTRLGDGVANDGVGQLGRLSTARGSLTKGNTHLGSHEEVKHGGYWWGKGWAWEVGPSLGTRVCGYGVLNAKCWAFRNKNVFTHPWRNGAQGCGPPPPPPSLEGRHGMG